MEVKTPPGPYQPTRVYLVRHGETEYNRKRMMQGRRINASLNETGREQAAALGERFADVRLDAVYASSLRRAIQTASAIVAMQSESPAVRCRTAFDEMCWGRYEGMPSCRELSAMLDETFTQWAAGNYAHRVPGGETILEVQKRSVEGFRDVVRRHQGETIAVVAHGRLLRVLLASLLAEYGLDRMAEIGHHNTCVNELIFDGVRCRAVALNCVRHLDEYQSAA